MTTNDDFDEARVAPSEPRVASTDLRGAFSDMRVALARIAVLTLWNAASGNVKTTEIGSTWSMTTSPVVSDAWTMLPTSTSRRPVRPEIGAVMAVYSSCVRAPVICASSFLTAASFCWTDAFCVSSVCCDVDSSLIRSL